MKDRVEFFSVRDMSIPWYYERAEEVVCRCREGWNADDVNDIIELYNILLFVENRVAPASWNSDVLMAVCDFKPAIISYFKRYEPSSWPELYAQIVFEYRHFFWEIVDRFNIPYTISADNMRTALADSPYELSYILRCQRLVGRNNRVVAELLRENENTAEWLLREFVEGEGLDKKERFSFPSALSLTDREKIISDYLDREEPNLNYVRLVLVSKKDADLRLSDEVMLKARRVERELNEKYLNRDNAMSVKYAVSIEDDLSKPVKWVKYEDSAAVFCYSRPIMLSHEGAELLHYCHYAFEFLNRLGMINLISRESDTDALERTLGFKGRFSYDTNCSFRFRSMISLLQIQGLHGALRADGRSIEAAVKDFYERYLKEKYGYPSTALSLPDPSADWIAKCRVIAPEIDAIAKRYDQYARKGYIDEELLQISSDMTRITGVHSCNRVRYYTLNGEQDDLYKLFHLFFSDQTMLAYVEPFKEKHYRSLLKLLEDCNGRIPYDNYAEYQKLDIDYLIDLGYLEVDRSGFISVAKKEELFILKHLYEFRALPVPYSHEPLQECLDEMLAKGWLKEDGHLLSPQERNYFDYYMYNSKYTNGPALRNRYLHGVNPSSADDKVHIKAYFRLLILLILALLKIEEDLAFFSARHRQE